MASPTTNAIPAPTVATDEAPARIVQAAFWLTATLLLVRLVLAGQFDLFFDEAYYWLWSTHLQPSYYDHPGMVAYFMAAGTALFGDTEFGVRVVGILSGAVDAVLIFAITARIFGSRRAAAWAMIFMNVNTVSALSVVMLPDQPMILFWLLSLYGMARLATGGHGAWWLLVGFAGGLAADAKLTTLVLALAVPLWLVLVPAMRRAFRTPWLYAGAAAAVIAVLPVALWNAENDWITVTFQFNREGFGFAEARVDGFIQYLTLFPLMATPPIFILSVIGYCLIGGRGWRLEPGRALLLLTPLPLGLYFAWHSFGEWVGTHWIAPLVVLLTIPAGYAAAFLRPGFWGRTARVSRAIAAPFGLGLTSIFYFAVAESFLQVPLRWDATERFRGYAEFAADAEAQRAEHGAAYILAPDYSTPAYLRFYLGRDEPAYHLRDSARWTYFGGPGQPPAELAGAAGLYIGRLSADIEERRIGRYFDSIVRVDDTVRLIRPGVVIEYPTWLVSDPRRDVDELFAPAVMQEPAEGGPPAAGEGG
ncbi:MAG: glycosyltransferase family 39 protein [Bauldia sp.]